MRDCDEKCTLAKQINDSITHMDGYQEFWKNLRGLHQIYDLSAMVFVLSVEIMASNKT
jgi:hypothetical protein